MDGGAQKVAVWNGRKTSKNGGCTLNQIEIQLFIPFMVDYCLSLSAGAQILIAKTCIALESFDIHVNNKFYCERLYYYIDQLLSQFCSLSPFSFVSVHINLLQSPKMQLKNIYIRGYVYVNFNKKNAHSIAFGKYATNNYWLITRTYFGLQWSPCSGNINENLNNLTIERLAITLSAYVRAFIYGDFTDNAVCIAR